jgi:hypothetical protein
LASFLGFMSRTLTLGFFDLAVGFVFMGPRGYRADWQRTRRR